jgi:hypothetical protein
MGCDIHCFVEVKDADGKWQFHNWRRECVPPEKRQKEKAIYDNMRDEYLVRIEAAETEAEKKELRKEMEMECAESLDYPWGIDYELVWEHPLYLGRNYDLFAILADVRNGRGFAGIFTGRGFEPISDPKGLPEDVTPEIQAISDRWAGDGHSHSYFTLAELQAYNWCRETTHCGWVGPMDYAKWKETGIPDNACGMIDGPHVEHIGHEQMNKIVAEMPESEKPEQNNPFMLEMTNGKAYFTFVQWGVTYVECVRYFLDEFMPALLELTKTEDCPEGNPENVRIVFFFDN